MKEQTLREKQEAFINDTVAYYSADPAARRNFVPDRGCFYKAVRPSSEGCAIGRHLTEDLCTELDCIDDNYTTDDGTGVNNTDVFNKLPARLRKLTQQFLTDMQQMHDHNVYWVGEGFEQRRENYLRTIRARLDREALKQ